MANCHEEFIQFNEKLNLSTSSFDRLKSAKRGIETQLHCHFDPLPDYHFKWLRSQGSKRLGTLIRRRQGTVDFDYGAYFYPKPPVSASRLIEMVYEALYGLSTQYEPEIKRRCIQVIYAERSRIHFDVPVYYLTKLQGDMKPYLATRSGWVQSSPYLFEQWYNHEYTPQLTRIVRYLKAWTDNQGEITERPKGVALTVLAKTHYCENKRDDVSFHETITGISESLTDRWFCQMPVAPEDNLLAKCTGNNRKLFLKNLQILTTAGAEALSLSRKVIALPIWGEQLGPYFI